MRPNSPNIRVTALDIAITLTHERGRHVRHVTNAIESTLSL